MTGQDRDAIREAVASSSLSDAAREAVYSVLRLEAERNHEAREANQWHTLFTQVDQANAELARQVEDWRRYFRIDSDHWRHTLQYAETALEGSSDNGDRYCAAQIRAALTSAEGPEQ